MIRYVFFFFFCLGLVCYLWLGNGVQELITENISDTINLFGVNIKGEYSVEIIDNVSTFVYDYYIMCMCLGARYVVSSLLVVQICVSLIVVGVFKPLNL
jgi:hypothetical protein